MVFIGSRSRYSEFKEDFLNDTGLKSEENPGIYAQYVTARFTDQNHKILTELMAEIREMQKSIKKL
ncbi:MAG TPA: hypothetical protein VHO46_11500 [Bacteroidales bacterium]|nr:hypothetical protein [Bacteroidales bacterium]